MKTKYNPLSSFNFVKEFKQIYNQENWRMKWRSILKYNFPSVDIEEDFEFRNIYEGFLVNGLIFELEQIEKLRNLWGDKLKTNEEWDQHYDIDCYIENGNEILIYSFKNYSLHQNQKRWGKIKDNLYHTKDYIRSLKKYKYIKIYVVTPYEIWNVGNKRP